MSINLTAEEDARRARESIRASSKRPMGAPKCTLKPYFILSLDLAWMRDYTALVLAEAVPVFVEGRWAYEYYIRDSEMTNKTIDPGDSYRAVAQRVYDRILGVKYGQTLHKKTVMTFDRTGVGGAVAEIFLTHKDKPKWLPIWPINSTDGGKPTGTGTHINVPKLSMVGTLQVILEGRRLKIAPELEHAAQIKEQLKQYIFKVKGGRIKTGNAKDETHDDFVTALMQMSWVGEVLLTRMEPAGNVKVTWG